MASVESTCMLHMLRSGPVKVLGRLHDYPMDERRRQASENLHK